MRIILVGEILFEFEITIEGFSYYFKVMFLSTSEHKMIAYDKNIVLYVQVVLSSHMTISHRSWLICSKYLYIISICLKY